MTDNDTHELGVIMLPMIFGPSWSFASHVRDLSAALGRRGRVTTVRLHLDRSPFFLPYVAGPKAGERRDALAAIIDDELVATRLSRAVDDLREKGCTKIALVGFGYGGIAAIRAAIAMNAAVPGSIDALVAWYPHLIMPEATGKTAPDLARIGCPGFVIYGDSGHETGNSVRLARLASALPGSNILVRVYVHADHGFADRFIQGAWPNPPYHREYGPESWRAVKRWLLELLRPAA